MDDLRAKAPWFVSGARTRHNSMPVLQIISEPSSEVLALIPYSDRTPKAHAECYADARLIAAAPDLFVNAKRVMELLEEHGASIVPHLLDNDDNAGQRLRDAIAKAEGRP